MKGRKLIKLTFHRRNQTASTVTKKKIPTDFKTSGYWFFNKNAPFFPSQVKFIRLKSRIAKTVFFPRAPTPLIKCFLTTILTYFIAPFQYYYGINAKILLLG